MFVCQCMGHCKTDDFDKWKSLLQAGHRNSDYKKFIGYNLGASSVCLNATVVHLGYSSSKP